MATIQVILEAVDKMSGDLKNVEARFGQLDKGMIRTSGTVAKVDDRFSSFSGSIKGVGAQIIVLNQAFALAQQAIRPITAAVGDLVTTFISFESAFTGVVKTVNASQAELQGLKEEFVDLSKEIPLTIEELFKIGELGGQLGITTDNLIGFTKTVAQLAATTNLTLESAATALARLSNIMQISQKDFDRLGSVIVKLGNNLATTEAEIVNFGLRIAGAGKTIGLNEAEVLAFGAALSSVGIRAEAGGTSISRIFIEMQKAVDQTSPKLKVFSSVAGTSIDKFVELFRDNAAEAVIQFVEGLGRAGDQSTQILTDIGLDALRVADSLRRMALAGDLLRDAILLANVELKENLALQREAELRFGTSASQLQLLNNQWGDLKRRLGETITPRLLSFLKSLGPAIDEVSARLKQPVLEERLAEGVISLKEIEELEKRLESQSTLTGRVFEALLLQLGLGFVSFFKTGTEAEALKEKLALLRVEFQDFADEDERINFELGESKKRLEEAKKATVELQSANKGLGSSLESMITSLEAQAVKLTKGEEESLKFTLAAKIMAIEQKAAAKGVRINTDELKKQAEQIVQLTGFLKDLEEENKSAQRAREARRAAAQVDITDFQEDPDENLTADEIARAQKNLSGVAEAAAKAQEERRKKEEKLIGEAFERTKRSSREFRDAFLSDRDKEVARIMDWREDTEAELLKLIEKWRGIAPELTKIYAQQLEQLPTITKDKLEKVENEAQKTTERIGRRAGETLADGIIDAMEGRKFDIADFFADIGRQIIQALLNAAIQALIIDPLVKNLKDLLATTTGPGGGGGKSFLGQAGGFLGAIGSIGNLFGFAKGGVVLSGAGPQQAFADIPPTALRRFQNGGIVRGPTLGVIGEEGDEIVARMKPARNGDMERKEEPITQNIFLVDQRRPNLERNDVELIITDGLGRKRGLREAVQNIIRSR